MSCIFYILKRYLIAGVFVTAWSLASNLSDPRVLDRNLLLGQSFVGQDLDRKQSTCKIQFSAMQPDFANRNQQQVNVHVSGRETWSKRFWIRGAANPIAPSAQHKKQIHIYRLGMGGYRAEWHASIENAQRPLRIDFLQLSSTTGASKVLLRCGKLEPSS